MCTYSVSFICRCQDNNPALCVCMFYVLRSTFCIIRSMFYVSMQAPIEIESCRTVTASLNPSIFPAPVREFKHP